MMFRDAVLIAAAICIVWKVQLGNSYRILGVFAAPSISHQMVFRALTLALNKRGHELVVVTTNPVNDTTLENYKEIDISFIYDAFGSTNHIENRRKKTCMEFIEDCADTCFHDTLDRILNHSDMKNLYAPHSKEKFDLMLVEMLLWPGVLPLAKRFNVPIIGITSMALTLNNQYTIGNPIMPSHDSNWELDYRIYEQRSFWQRLGNFISVWRYLYWYRTTFIARQNSIARKYFGNDIPDLNDIEKNVSLVFVNQLGPISYARPNCPKVINIGGIHISKESPPLPKELRTILDRATAGFVYMSLGSNVKSTMLPNKTRNAFISAFSRLPYKVLWKFEDDILPGKPDNVHIMKWVPQQAVLAHPNLKVFVYQGGLQSTEEAIANAVPLVGFPVFADQEMQVTKLASLGVAVKLEISAVDENELYEAISTLAGDSSYKQKMLNLRSIIEDKPHDPLENAIWWTEHVIRHGGAPHLHPSTADEPWYSRQDMDIVAFITTGSVLVLSVVFLILYRVVKSIGTHTGRSYDVKSKIN